MFYPVSKSYPGSVVAPSPGILDKLNAYSLEECSATKLLLSQFYILRPSVCIFNIHIYKCFSIHHGVTPDKPICSSLNENDPHRLIGSSPIRRCGLIGVDVTLLEKVGHWG